MGRHGDEFYLEDIDDHRLVLPKAKKDSPDLSPIRGNSNES